MKNKKIIEFFKERWQHILLWFCGVLLVLFVLIGKNCNALPTLKAFSDDIYDIESPSYSILTYDCFLLRSNMISNNYVSLPISNEVFSTLDNTTTNTFDCNLGTYRFNIPTPQQYRITLIDGPPLNELILFSSYMYIPNNILDYYVTPDRLMLGTSSNISNDLTCTINLSYKLHTIDSVEVEDTTLFYNLNMLFADGFDVFNGLDLSGLVFAEGCVITDYYLSISFSEPILLNWFEVSRIGVIDLPSEVLFPPFAEVCEVCEICPILPPQGVDVGSFLANSVGAFMDFEIFPGFSISGLLATILAVGLFILFLKVFAGG